MKPSTWPNWMDHLKAKSEKFGGETLAEHTWDVLEKLAELRQLRPNLPELIQVPRLWHCLFWACFLHDFGKAARGFQARLAGGPAWRDRHEVLSLAFLNWVSTGLSKEEQDWVLAAIVSHHRDATYIQSSYPDVADDPLVPLLGELDEGTLKHLWRWFAECATAWRDALGFSSDEVEAIDPPDCETAVDEILANGVKHVREWLYRYEDWLYELDRQEYRVCVLGVLLRGLTTSADHMASAHLKSIPSPIQEAWHSLAKRILKPGQTPYRHQQASAAAHGTSTILIAPTGSGKTEAALYWALGDGSRPVARIFYALPYQASMNAMFDRLRDTQKGFQEEAVGLQHGRAVQAMYARLIDKEEWSAKAANESRWQKNINTLNARPIKVFSPYQMLKAMFQIRGFEAMLTDYADASFIFDEIHAYDPGRLALILALVKHLREWYGARFFMMSATFPNLIRESLKAALGPFQPIVADTSVFERFRRHRLHLLDGDLLEQGISAIVDDVRSGKQVLVCVNTVKRSQEVLHALRKHGLGEDELLLIHSRYTFSDRNKREQSIRDLCGVGIESKRRPLALVATQVVEVSLNIDLDTIYSDPAPLEALLQRFGRVNRSCSKGICPVHVFRQPNDGQGVYGRSKDKALQGHIVRVTLAELERHDGHEIDEAQVNDWLNNIYADPELSHEWLTSYQHAYREASDILRSLRPFNSDETKEEAFENLFDGIDVVPERFEQQYTQHLMNDEFIEASNFLVNIGKQRFAQFAKQGRMRRAESEDRRGAWIARLSYDDELGLLFEDAQAD